jgi:hypothetical protein
LSYRKVFTSTVYETEHPVVRVHPISGERALQLGHFVKRIKGYSLADSQHLFAVLQGHVTRLENTVRWRWQAGAWRSGTTARRSIMRWMTWHPAAGRAPGDPGGRTCRWGWMGN